MSKVNRVKDEFFYQKIQNGDYIVSKDGTIKNTYGKSLGTVNSKGYVTLGSLYDGKLLIIQAHRVVWMALKGWIPDGFEPNHKDGIKTNNKIKNLELKTFTGNIQHAFDTGLNLGPRGKLNGQVKLTAEQVSKARRLIAKNKYTVAKLAKRYGVSRATMYLAVTGKTWAYLEQSPVISVPKKIKYPKTRISIEKLMARGISSEKIADILIYKGTKMKRSSIYQYIRRHS